jgi:hypothetical protein
LEFPLDSEGKLVAYKFNAHVLDLSTRQTLYTIDNLAMFPTVKDDRVYYGTLDNKIIGRQLLSGKTIFALDINL